MCCVHISASLSGVLQPQGIFIMLPSHQGVVSVLTTAHLVGYMKVMRVGIND